jgi:hypothetical protein
MMGTRGASGFLKLAVRTGAALRFDGIEVGPEAAASPASHADARLVHEDEHVIIPWFSSPKLGIALAVIPEIHEAGGRSVNPHFVSIPPML